jgi:hypothetical protein
VRRFWLILLPIFLLAACSAPAGSFADAQPFRAVAGTPLELTGVSPVAENGVYSLWVDPEYASFEIRSAGGTVWRSLPERFDDPEWVNSMLISNLASILTVTSLDSSQSRQELMCYEHCVQNGTVRYETIPNGVRFIFRYARQGITVPLDIVLTDDGFIAQVAPGGIVEDGAFTVHQIMLLPYFNSGTSGDDGFLFYPDGSGAVSAYDKDYNNAADMTQPVYGFDRGIGAVEIISRARGYRMPVYGVKTNDAAYLAVIEGASPFIASVHTGVMRRNNRYFKNGVIFTYRDVGRVFLRDSATTVATSYTIPAPVTAAVPLTLRVLLLEGDDVRYTDMAFAYRDYLERTGVFTERNGSAKSAHLTLMGALVRPSSFLGIPMDREITLTTFEQAGEIIDTLHNAGVKNMSVNFKGAQAGGYNSQWTRGSFPFSRALGGRRGWEAFLSAHENDVYLGHELLQVYKTGRGFSASRDAARTTGNGLNFQNDYFIQDGSRNSYARRWFLLSPSLWAETFALSTTGRQSANRWGVSVESAGSMVYSDYCQNNPAFRDLTGPVLVEGLESLGNLALTGGNAYTWGIARALYDVPLGASGYFIQSGEVPFYQLVARGYIEYSGEAMNLSPDKQLSLLRSVEYGALPHYFGIYAPSSDLNRSILEGMFSANYLDWIADAAGQAAQIGDLYSRIAGSRMANHEQLAPGVFRTSYENGVTVTVDYNARAFTVEVAG